MKITNIHFVTNSYYIHPYTTQKREIADKNASHQNECAGRTLPHSLERHDDVWIRQTPGKCQTGNFAGIEEKI